MSPDPEPRPAQGLTPREQQLLATIYAQPAEQRHLIRVSADACVRAGYWADARLARARLKRLCDMGLLVLEGMGVARANRHPGAAAIVLGATEAVP